MIPALIIVFREGFEAFLSVAIILAYLQKTGRNSLRPAVYWGIGVALLTSAALGFVLGQVNQPLWEGVLGIVAIFLVSTFVIHIWRTAPHLKKDVETRLETYSSKSARWLSLLGVFFFTVLMITREGMETALMLIQVRTGKFILGSLLGLAAAALMSWAWAHYGHRIDIRRFFQVTGMFLLLFTIQIAVYSIHEFSEAGLLPNSEAIHTATEPYGPVGYYGRWFSLFLVAVCGTWLASVSAFDRRRRTRTPLPASSL
jgi:high-affinity iron transporter